MSDKNKPIIFFGAGEVCRLSIGYATKRGIEIDCVIDNDPAKHGTQFKGLPIRSPEYLKSYRNGEVEIVVTVGEKAQGAIITQLANLGFVYGADVKTFIDVFFNGGMPSVSAPGYMELENGLTLLTPISDCFLIYDKESNAVYRAVTPEKGENNMCVVFERVNASDKLRDMIVPTCIADSAIINNISPLVFRHTFIEPVSYSFEWSPAMLKDYMLFMLDFIAELDQAGLGISDPSAYNATFFGGKFIYVDYSGIYWDKTARYILQSFIELNVNHLILITKSAGKGYMFLKSTGYTVRYQDFVGYLSESEQSAYTEMVSRCLESAEQGHIIESCDILREYVNSITAGWVSLTNWTGYQDALFEYESIAKQSNTALDPAWTDKQRNVISMIRQVKPRTMIDLAGNMGWYSIAMSRELDYAITADYDMGISDKAYEMVKLFGITNVLPVYLDIISPTPPYYPGRMLSTNAIKPKYKSAIERFRCDVVLALAVEHHLALSQGLSFEEIVKQLALFTNKHLIIEFCDRDDKWVINYLKQYDPIRTAWYTRENFEAALSDTFQIITTAESETSSRTLYLCEKRQDLI